MMIFGFAVTAPLAGHFLDPYSAARLVEVTGVVSAVAFARGKLAVIGVERGAARRRRRGAGRPPFGEAFREVWAEPAARRFTVFIFVSMLAYSAQELLVEPFAGPRLRPHAGRDHQARRRSSMAGVLLGMIIVAIGASAIGGPRLGNLTRTGSSAAVSPLRPRWSAWPPPA